MEVKERYKSSVVLANPKPIPKDYVNTDQHTINSWNELIFPTPCPAFTGSHPSNSCSAISDDFRSRWNDIIEYKLHVSNFATEWLYIHLVFGRPRIQVSNSRPRHPKHFRYFPRFHQAVPGQYPNTSHSNLSSHTHATPPVASILHFDATQIIQLEAGR